VLGSDRTSGNQPKVLYNIFTGDCFNICDDHFSSIVLPLWARKSKAANLFKTQVSHPEIA
jgi:hypothetical protein